jgi:hypothetical protein
MLILLDCNCRTLYRNVSKDAIDTRRPKGFIFGSPEALILKLTEVNGNHVRNVR